MATHTALPVLLPYHFSVSGSPVSVNRYGQAVYRAWRAKVHAESVNGAIWSKALTTDPCTVHVRYFWHLDRRKDVDNVLKAILDGLDGKIGTTPKPTLRVLGDDREVERVVSQRTRLAFGTRLHASRMSVEEYRALRLALVDEASVFIGISGAPDHNRSITR
jgi:Holliday junction resolvase RusA-like endonuclease